MKGTQNAVAQYIRILYPVYEIFRVLKKYEIRFLINRGSNPVDKLLNIAY